MAVTRQIFEEAFGASNRDQIYALALRFANAAKLVGLPLTFLRLKFSFFTSLVSGSKNLFW